MAVIIVPFAVALVGCFVYAFASNPKVSELGRISFFVGMLWLVFLLSRVVIHV